MQESIVVERYDNLHTTIKDALQHMKSDGLVEQLQKHKDSKKYAAGRLNEVLHEFMNCSREKYIQKLQHDCEEAEIIHDQIIYKIQRVQTRNEIRNHEILSKTSTLKHEKEQIVSKIKKISNELKEMDKGFNKIVTKKGEQIEKMNEILDNLKDSVTSLKLNISEIKSQFSSVKTRNLRNIKQTQSVLKEQVEKCLANDGMKYPEASDELDIFEKEEEIRRIKDSNEKLKSSMKVITDHINKLSLSCGVKEKLSEKNIENIANSLQKVYRIKSEEEVSRIIGKNGKKVDLSAFLKKAKSNYENELLKKEKEIEELIRQARQRRKKLEYDLQMAMKQLQELRQSGDSDDEDKNIFSEIQKSRKDYKSTIQVLDDTISKLAMNSESSVRSNFE